MSILWVTFIILLYGAARWLYARSNQAALLHPMLLPILIVMGVVIFMGPSAATLAQFEADTAALTFMLGPAALALSVPLYEQRAAIKAQPAAVVAGLVGGSLVSVVVALGVLQITTVPPEVFASFATRAITTPFAIVTAYDIGGLPSLAAAVVIFTGLLTAVFGPWFLRLLKVDDPVAAGIAMGVNGHGVATAEALKISDVMGAASSFAMALNGLLTAIILPIIF